MSENSSLCLDNISTYLESCDFKNCALIEKYEICVIIGEGTHGTVFKAKEKKTSTKVAVKRINCNSKPEKFPINILREIYLLKKVHHENVVNLIEICRTRLCIENNYLAKYFLIFEFCEHDLNGLLLNHDVNFTTSEKKSIMKQIFNGLNYIHSLNILHRDIKTSNILVTRFGVIKIADFGLSKIHKGQGQLTTNVVTRWYRAPELLLGDNNYGQAIDIWSVGCVMAELWIRAPLLKGRTEQHQLTLITQLCGSMTRRVWPNVYTLPLFNNIKLAKSEKRKIRTRLNPHLEDPYAVDLVDKLLTLDPEKRITAESALQHSYFHVKPCPVNFTLTHLKQCYFTYLHSSTNTEQNQTHAFGGKPLNIEDTNLQDVIF